LGLNTCSDPLRERGIETDFVVAHLLAASALRLIFGRWTPVISNPIFSFQGF
jgi:hypothetical protein